MSSEPETSNSEPQTTSETVLERLAQNVQPTPAPTPKRRAPKIKAMSTKRQKKEESDDESIYDEDKEIESTDGDDDDDSIVVPDDEDIEVESGDIPDDSEETAKILAKVLEEEAKKFIKVPLQSVEIGGRSLRNRATIKKPDDSHEKLIANAFALDEKKELIKELGIWKRKLATEAAENNVIFPHLDIRMPLEFIQEEHRKVRLALNLESSDDETEESEEESDSEAEIESESDSSESESEESDE